MTRHPLPTLVVALALAGCNVSMPGMAGGAPAVAPAFGLNPTPASLYAPSVFDWTSQRVSSALLKSRREARYHTLAFPAAAANWSSGGAGLPLTSYGCTATDFVPNGPASSMHEVAGHPTYNKIYFLTKAGRLLKIDRSTPTSYAAWAAPAGKTFSRTFVTLSPKGSRAYVLSDDGVLYVVNTLTMVTAATIPVGGGGFGIAPWLDPFQGRDDDQAERVFVATNAGAVNQYDVTGTPTGTVTAVSGATTYNVATAVTPLFSGTRRIAAPPVVLGGTIFVGDMAGNFHVYDTNDPANVTRYPMGAPITTAPALEIQDGSYSFTDVAGNPKAVANGEPVYAWVNAGGSCAWVNLHDQTVTRSQPLRLDDNDTDRFGYLLDYSYSTAGTTERLAAVDGGNVNTEVPDRNLPGYGAIRSNDYLVPADTNTYAVGGAARGGPVVSYVRWQSSASYAPGAVITGATLSLRPVDFLQYCRVPEIRSTSSYNLGGLTTWASNTLTNANRPAIGLANLGTFTSTGVNGAGNALFSSLVSYQWDVSPAFSAPAGDGRYALALRQNNGGAVYWPNGPVAGGGNLFQPNAANPEAVRFQNNALNADPSAAGTNDDRPTLTLRVATAQLPSATIETPPFIDSVDKRVYVFYTNAVYSIDFSSPDAFADTLAGQKRTIFNQTSQAATFAAQSRYVGNFTAPVPAWDLKSVFVLSRVPTSAGTTPTTWTYALGKIGLPLSATANRLATGTQTYTGITGQVGITGLATEREASSYMAIDPVPGSNGVYFGLGNGRIYSYTP